MTRIAGFGEREAIAHQAKVKGTPLSREERMAAIAARNQSAAARQAELPTNPTRKFHNNPNIYNRIAFGSGRERNRYIELLQLAHAGLIRNLVTHPLFELQADGGELIGRYRADFSYYTKDEAGAWVEVVEDVKSPPTARKETYRRTWRLIRAQYGIEIRTVW